ncbi:hypothetical protein [Nocardia nepalensis]|uniref:hypothetical protein n=1 Tax=Nocardia nepalensis TaxID=3375448 RepID=UPI003B6751CE
MSLPETALSMSAPEGPEQLFSDHDVDRMATVLENIRMTAVPGDSAAHESDRIAT